MAKISIEYCYDCMFLGRASEIANVILQNYQQHIEVLSLIPAHDGFFTIWLNGEEIYKIGENGLPPSPEEALGIVGQRLK